MGGIEGQKLEVRQNVKKWQNDGGGDVINTQQNIDNARRLTIENDIIDYLGDNADRNVVSGILKKNFKIEDLENFNKSIKTFEPEERGGKTRDFLYYINTGDKPNQAMTNVLTGRSKSKSQREAFKSEYSDNFIMQNLGDAIEESIKNGENPFIGKGDNPYYAVKIPKNLQQQLKWGDPVINDKVRGDEFFVIEDLSGEDISRLKNLTIINSGERLYELIKKSDNPHELIKDNVFFEQFKRFVYQDEKVTKYTEEDKVKQQIEGFYKWFLNDNLCLNVEGLDTNIGDEWKRWQEEINREYMRIIEEAQEKAREVNNGGVSRKYPGESLGENKETNMNNSSNSATGVEIAEKFKLGNKLGTYGINLDSYNANYSDLQEIAFSNERQDFIMNNDELSGIITKDDMVNYNIFDKEHNMLNLEGRQDFCKGSVIAKRMKTDKLESLWKILQDQFFLRYKNTFNTLLNNPSTQKESVSNYIKNYAIGSVIDNIKGIFTEMAKNFEGNLSNKGFVFTDNEPVKIDGDNLIIKGSFNGTDIVIRYNLSTGEVFMNSFIQYNATDNKFKIGENSSAYQKIGDFEKFSDFLSNRYESKFQNLNDVKNISNNIQLIGEEILNTSKRQSAKNTAVMKLLKTYNILGYPGGLENIDFNSDSKFFKFFQIVDETARNNRVDALDYFNNKFMPIIMEYNGLTWGENNLEQNKTNPKSSIFFDESSDNQTLVELRKLIGNFNPNAFKGIGNFDATQNLGILDFILGNLLNTTGTEIDISKMDDFIRRLESGGKKL